MYYKNKVFTNTADCSLTVWSAVQHLGCIQFSKTETGSSLVSTVLSIRLQKLEPVSWNHRNRLLRRFVGETGNRILLMFTFRDGGKVSSTTFLSYYSSDNHSLAANYRCHDVLTHLHIAFCKINLIVWRFLYDWCMGANPPRHTAATETRRPFDYSCETEAGFGFYPEPVSLNRIRP